MTVVEPQEDEPVGAAARFGTAGQEAQARPEGCQGWRSLLVGAAAYLALSVGVWWNIWSTHPTSTTTCGCGDSSLFTWFLEWPAFAISHGLNPLYSTYLFHPTGVNLLSNTAEVGLGVVLAPVTWLFGPIATLNVALTLSPYLSALAVYVLLRRWVSWSPAAFVGGLLYGFSPFVLMSLSDAHLMLGMAPVPPLIVLCLDEMFVRQRWRPLVVGIAVGVLVTVQLLIGTEVLVIIVMSAAVGVGLVVVAAVASRRTFRSRVSYIVRSAAAAAVASVVMLAYPVWFALAGPAHLSGPIWGAGVSLNLGGANLRTYVTPTAPYPQTTTLAHLVGGYQGLTLSQQYLGWGLVMVLVVGLVAWRRDLRLWLFGALGVVAALLSEGLMVHQWTPWRLVTWLPQIGSIIPGRFAVMVYLCAAIMLGIVVDHVYAVVRDSGGSSDASTPLRPPGAQVRKLTAAFVALVVAGIALVPIASYLSSQIPLTAVPVVLPTWFRTVAPNLRGHQVLLAFPPPFAYRQSSMTWQAVNRMSYAMAGGAGPGAIASRQGKEEAGEEYLADLDFLGAGRPVTPPDVAVVRTALDGWEVTKIVLPNPAGLATYESVTPLRSIVAVMTAATGELPVYQADAWVWSGVDRAGPPVTLTKGELAACTRGSPEGSVVSIQVTAGCILASGPGT